ncbi:glycosyltransferase family 61 protein [Flavobacteriales bacterium]|nr:glycosyltransferase family 61 protein [Flavobacteriales bacterium]
MRSAVRIILIRLLKGMIATFGYPQSRTASLWVKGWYVGKDLVCPEEEILGHLGTTPQWDVFLSRIQSLKLPQGVRSDIYPAFSCDSQDMRVHYKDVRAVGIHPTVFGSDGTLCKLPRHQFLQPFHHGHVRLEDLISIESDLAWSKGQVIELEKAVILDARQGHFGHWVFEQLPQLRLLCDVDGLIFICNGKDDWKRQLLEDFGVNPDCIVGYDGETNFSIHHLIATNGGQLNQIDLGWLRYRALELYPKMSSSPRRIYVSRQGVGSRMVSNFEDILPVLSEFGFEIVQPEKLGLARSAAVFRDAECILGPEGSGMRNMVWSDGAKVLEIFGHELNYGQWQMAFALGLVYHPYMERREVPDTKGRWRDVDAMGISVDPVLFRRFLSTHL